MKRKILLVLIFSILLSVFSSFTSCAGDTCTVNFDCGSGSTVDSVVVWKGDKIEEPVSFKEGEYRFLGWFYAGKKWDFFTDRVKNNMTLSAIWENGFTDGLDYKLNDEGTGYTVLNFGEAKDHHIAIPEEYRDLPIVGIEDNAFYGCNKIRCVWIPSTVKFIGNNAFGNCTTMEYINIPSAVEEIGEGAFSNCTSLKEITLPYGLKEIKKSTFNNCKELTMPEIPVTVTHIGDRSFCYCESVTAVTIPWSVEYLGNEAFYGCIALSEIVIPPNVSYVGEGSFSNCVSLVSAQINATTQTIGKNAFSGCSQLTYLTLPDTLMYIGYKAFYNCKSLTSVRFPVLINEIRTYAFKYSGVKEIIYVGTAENWSKVDIWEQNDVLRSANVTFENNPMPDVTE